ncbi:hypothetical protein J2X13_004827 [Aminobacter aminovorans]|nr:hypothetical protein [Aminobacter aminovorans]MDR7224394.1 hypothetical protein [Aminobacter aminovorans]
MTADRQAEERRLAVPHFAPASRLGKASAVDDEFLWAVHIDLHHVAEISSIKQFDQAGKMPAQPEVIVAAIGDDLAARFLQDDVPVGLAMALAFWEIEIADARIVPGKRLDDVACLGRCAVADYEQLEILKGLILDAAQCIADQVRMVVRWHQYGGKRLVTHAARPALYLPRS